MLLNWLKSQDAVDAGSALADSFPTHSTGDAVAEFLRRATQDLRARKLNFYKRARFANAFKWRLLEKGVAPDTAREVTQTLLVSGSVPAGAGTTPAAAAAAAAPRPTTSPAKAKGPVDRNALSALFRQGEESFARGAYGEAIAHYQDYIASRPRDTAALNNLAVALTVLGRHTEAEVQLRKAIARNPKNVDAHSNLGKSLLQRSRWHDAETSFRRVVSLKPTDLQAHTELGHTLVQTGRLDDARTEFEHVLKVSPRHTGALCGMALLERTNGRFAEAETLLRRALEVDPNLATAWAGIPALRRMNENDSQWLEGAEKAAANTPSPADKAAVRFAVGKYFDDLGQYPKALESFQRAKGMLKPRAPAYDPQARIAFVNDMTNVYTPQALANSKATGSPATRHTFVIGMPRSGTSLIEQILAAHPAVTSVGELDFWYDLVRRDEANVRREILPQQTRQKIAAEYLTALRRYSRDGAHIVERTPVNADLVGLIHSVFPHARFIYMKRDPADTCLSCYFQHFPVTQNFAAEPTDLAHYYSEHARLIAHWRKILPPGTWLDVPYEALVADPQAWTQKLLEFLDLELDVRCLKFNESQRPVPTSVAWQVRQPVYGSSVGRSNNYSKFVTPLRKLDPA
jgi:Flp pilus assembly protein TadD